MKGGNLRFRRNNRYNAKRRERYDLHPHDDRHGTKRMKTQHVDSPRQRADDVDEDETC